MRREVQEAACSAQACGCGGGQGARRRANTWPLWLMAAVLTLVGLYTGEKPWFALALVPAASAILWQLALNWADAHKG